jgi:aprataxin
MSDVSGEKRGDGEDSSTAVHGMSDVSGEKRGDGEDSSAGSSLIVPAYNFDHQPERAVTSDFRDVLFRHFNGKARPEDTYLHTPECVVLYDAYPKARVHLLVIPRPSFLVSNGIEDLCPKDLPKVEYMHRLANLIAASPEMAAALASKPNSGSTSGSSSSSSSSSVRTGGRLLQGYHANPSLRPLHLHLISDDFCPNRDYPTTGKEDKHWRDCIKHKKHWLSFTTDFFVAPSAVEALLRDKGRAAAPNVPLGDTALGTKEDREAHLRGPLRCHVCATQVKDMPKLKAHLFTHCT